MGAPASESFGVSYQWDNEGKMTSYYDLVNDQYVYQYDGMGRAIGLRDSRVELRRRIQETRRAGIDMPTRWVTQ